MLADEGKLLGVRAEFLRVLPQVNLWMGFDDDHNGYSVVGIGRQNHRFVLRSLASVHPELPDILQHILVTHSLPLPGEQMCCLVELLGAEPGALPEALRQPGSILKHVASYLDTARSLCIDKEELTRDMFNGMHVDALPQTLPQTLAHQDDNPSL